ncbi:PiggyBac transposable element-derived protein 4 [Plakobranchus ocellatus]|uniref:PiggyBac transposable element-derived protein 4 n=1 Tax=Plakobranchus ocellatus TaxID=259542 RepID=A0AAV4B2Z6_9GAST|nr:PiggyBac transposable element-derived protein 4 [Plakobranchus ocellatus]
MLQWTISSLTQIELTSSSRRKTTIVGSVRRNKRFLPNELQAKKKLKLNDSLFGFSDNKCILSYQGHKNKNVILLSIMHIQPVILPRKKGSQRLSCTIIPPKERLTRWTRCA